MPATRTLFVRCLSFVIFLIACCLLSQIFSPVRAQAPSTDNLFQVPVLVLAYYPTLDGINIDSSETGMARRITDIKRMVGYAETRSIKVYEDGSKYHGYKNPSAQPSLDYRIHDRIEFNKKIPRGLEVPWKPGEGILRPDYMGMLNEVNICNYVQNQGVKEVWIWGYHYGNLEPTESNMSGPWGDISNSERTNDLPLCGNKTYVVYNMTYPRLEDNATYPGDIGHIVGHQIESVLNRADLNTYQTFEGEWQNYNNTGNTQSDFNRCGWTHNPPNIGDPQYIYWSTRTVWTDCEDWTIDGSGQKVQVNCSKWNCKESDFHIWRMQNMPGRNNGNPMFSNWWTFIGDYDLARTTNLKLIYPQTTPLISCDILDVTDDNVVNAQDTQAVTNAISQTFNAKFDVNGDNVVNTQDVSAVNGAVGTTCTTGNVAYWNLNQGSGSFATDSSGQSNHGLLSNGPTWTTGKCQGGLNFDGSNDQVLISSGLGLSDKNLTISAWVNIDSGAEKGAFVQIGSSLTGFGIGVGGTTVENTGNNLILIYEGVRWISTNRAIGTGWHHVAMTVNSSGVPEGFIDGASIGTFPGTAGRAPGSAGFIGGYDPARYFNGIIDEVRVYNRALSSGEISADMGACHPASPQPTPSIIPTPTPAPIPCETLDVNDDNVVDSKDASEVTNAIGKPYNAKYDVNNSGAITLQDVGFVNSGIGTICTNPSSPTPTPAPSASPRPNIPCDKVDVNHSGRIDTVDIAIVNSHWGSDAHTVSLYDMNGDSVVDVKDTDIVRMFFNETCDLPSPTPLPSPGPVVLSATTSCVSGKAQIIFEWPDVYNSENGFWLDISKDKFTGDSSTENSAGGWAVKGVAPRTDIERANLQNVQYIWNANSQEIYQGSLDDGDSNYAVGGKQLIPEKNTTYFWRIKAFSESQTDYIYPLTSITTPNC